MVSEMLVFLVVGCFVCFGVFVLLVFLVLFVVLVVFCLFLTPPKWAGPCNWHFLFSIFKLFKTVQQKCKVFYTILHFAVLSLKKLLLLKLVAKNEDSYYCYYYDHYFQNSITVSPAAPAPPPPPPTTTTTTTTPAAAAAAISTIHDKDMAEYLTKTHRPTFASSKSQEKVPIAV